MKTILFVPACLLFLLLNDGAKAQGWRSIVPLHSKRADVERLFGIPNPSDGFYNFDKESVKFRFSDGRCINGWNIPRGTVIEVRIVPKPDLRLKDLRIDTRSFKKAKDGELPGIFFYSNDERGISVKTSDGIVVDVTYGWTTKDRHLLCNQKSVGQEH